MIKTENLIHVSEVEKVLIPTALRELSLDFLIPNIESYILELFHLSGVTEILESDLSFSKHSFEDANKKRIYVLVINFPFDLSKEYVGCLCRGFIVFSPILKKVHYFEEELTEVALDNPLRLKLRYCHYTDSEIISYDVMDRTIDDDRNMAMQCPSFAYGEELTGVAGFVFKSFDEVEQMIEDRNRVLVTPIL